jgi:hypothetical protein
MSKQCATCNTLFTPKNANDRHKSCRDCHNAHRRELRRVARPDIVAHEADLASGNITCNECNVTKPASEFRPKRRKCKTCSNKLDVIAFNAKPLDPLIKTIQGKLETEGLKYHKSKLYLRLIDMITSDSQFLKTLLVDMYSENREFIGNKLAPYIKAKILNEQSESSNTSPDSSVAGDVDIEQDETELSEERPGESNDDTSIDVPFEDKTGLVIKQSVLKINFDRLLNYGINISKPESIATHPLNIPAPKIRTKMSPEKEGVIKACRTRLRRIFKSKGIGKQKHTREYIGCDYDFLMKWLSFNLQEGMTLENRGAVWHIDHVLPISTFDIEQDMNHVCFHWVNLAPLTATENLSKGNRTQYEQVCNHFENLKKFLKQENMSLEPQYLELFARHLIKREAP